MEKGAIFIDGGYLDKLLQKWGDFPLDYLRFSEKICKLLNIKLLRVYYYNCLPIIRRMYKIKCTKCKNEFRVNFKPSEEKKIYCDNCLGGRKRKQEIIRITKEQTEKDEKLYIDKEKFYNKLKRLPCFEVKYGRLQIIKGIFKQKMIDVKMSLDIVDKCFENQIQHAIIIAGDGDFIPAIKKAKNYGAIVHLFCNKKRINRELLYTIDKFHNLKFNFIKDLKMK